MAVQPVRVRRGSSEQAITDEAVQVSDVGRNPLGHGSLRPDLAHLVSFPGVVDGVEPGLDVGGDGVFSGDDGVAGLDVDGSVAA